MKIGILGSGKVAQTLGAAWAAHGHEVHLGARNPQAQAQPSTVQIGTLEAAAASGEVVLLAVNPWTEIEHVLRPLVESLRGKVIIDVSNNIIVDGRPKLAFTDKSMGEFVQSLLPASSVVKTLNITFASMMVEPAESGIIPAIGWVAGNDTEAKAKVATLVKDLGWNEVIDLGDIHQAILQENVGLILALVMSRIMASSGNNSVGDTI